VDNTSAVTPFADNERVFLILQLQVEIMEEIFAIQELVKNAVINQEWTDFDTLLGTINQYSDNFHELETERVSIFDKISGKRSNFYNTIIHFPEEERKKFSELYRSLKMKTLKVRMSNESLIHYLDEAKTTIDTFLDAAYPDRKNRLYSPWGAKVSADMRSMIVNHSL